MLPTWFVRIILKKIASVWIFIEHIFLGCALEQQKRIAELEHRIHQIENSFQGKK
jgi:hypothetical protein